MAERRMFAKTIIDSDAFLDMPLSTQALYFHLSMRADDDGFINNPKKIQRMVGCADDDLKLLIAKNFLIPFDNGVVVIKHWKIHNYIQKDRYKPTVYQEEMKLLSEKDNHAYTLDTQCIHDGYSSETQVRLGKDSIDKNNNIISSNEDICPSEPKDDKPQRVLQDIVDEWNQLEAYGIKPIRYIIAESTRHKLIRTRLKQHGRESFDEVIERIKTSRFLQGKTAKPFMIDFDWVIRPDNYQKTLDGKYNREQQEPVIRSDGSKPHEKKWQ